VEAVHGECYDEANGADCVYLVVSVCAGVEEWVPCERVEGLYVGVEVGV